MVIPRLPHALPSCWEEHILCNLQKCRGITYLLFRSLKSPFPRLSHRWSGKSGARSRSARYDERSSSRIRSDHRTHRRHETDSNDRLLVSTYFSFGIELANHGAQATRPVCGDGRGVPPRHSSWGDVAWRPVTNLSTCI